MRRQFDYGNVETYKTATPAVIARYGFRWNGEANGLGLHADAYARTISKRRFIRILLLLLDLIRVIASAAPRLST